MTLATTEDVKCNIIPIMYGSLGEDLNVATNSAIKMTYTYIVLNLKKHRLDKKTKFVLAQSTTTLAKTRSLLTDIFDYPLL